MPKNYVSFASNLFFRSQAPKSRPKIISIIVNFQRKGKLDKVNDYFL